MKIALLAILFLCSCSVRIEDSRVSREEIAGAFAQRDEAIRLLTESIKALDSKLVTKK